MTIAPQDFERLVDEHHLLIGQYARVQKHCSQLIAAQAAEIENLQAQAMRLRARVIVRDTALAWAREDRAALEAATPGLPRRVALARHVKALTSRIQDLLRERSGWRQGSLPDDGAVHDAQAVIPPAGLQATSVLCVGRDAVSAGAAQRVVEMAGARFLHHDGLDAKDKALEASLLAADLVICQAGCVSHKAYWRVQDHCRRTGKQCVLVDQPQAMHFVRSMNLAATTAGVAPVDG